MKKSVLFLSAFISCFINSFGMEPKTSAATNSTVANSTSSSSSSSATTAALAIASSSAQQSSSSATSAAVVESSSSSAFSSALAVASSSPHQPSQLATRKAAPPPRIAPSAEPSADSWFAPIQSIWQSTFCASADNIIQELGKRDGKFAHEETAAWRTKNQQRVQNAIQECITKNNYRTLTRFLECLQKHTIEVSQDQLLSIQACYSRCKIKHLEHLLEQILKEPGVLKRGEECTASMLKDENILHLQSNNPELDNVFDALKLTLSIHLHAIRTQVSDDARKSYIPALTAAAAAASPSSAPQIPAKPPPAQ